MCKLFYRAKRVSVFTTKGIELPEMGEAISGTDFQAVSRMELMR
jgi:hypothetical protein